MGSYFCSRRQTMTMPLASLEASRLSSQLKLTSSTGALWPCSLLTAAFAARSTSKKCTHMSSLPVTAQRRRSSSPSEHEATCVGATQKEETEVCEVLRDFWPRWEAANLDQKSLGSFYQGSRARVLRRKSLGRKVSRLLGKWDGGHLYSKCKFSESEVNGSRERS